MNFYNSIIDSMNRLCDCKDKLLVCVSGGIDSVVLLDIIKKGGWNFSVAHCNFSLRGEESNGDEKFVRELCKKYNAICHVIKFDTNKYAKDNKINTQIAARELRYNYFSELKKEYGYDYIVVAHHLDDSIETFFINLIRGTGLKGLSGISESRNDIIRPMLGVTRGQIIEYANENHLSHREDSSNSQDHYLRNRIRHHIIPLFQELSENFRETMYDNLNRLAETEKFIENSIARIEVCARLEDDRGYTIQYIKESKYFHLILFRILQQYGFGSSVISQLEVAIKKGETSKWFYGNRYRLLLEKEILTIHDLEKTEYKEITINPDSSILEILDVKDAGEYKRKPKTIAYIDYENIEFPLTFRKWKAGDRIHPLGLKGSKTIGDFLTDRKISLSDRENTMVLTDSTDNIIWVAGIEIDDRYKITDKTRKVIKLDASKFQGNDI